MGVTDCGAVQRVRQTELRVRAARKACCFVFFMILLRPLLMAPAFADDTVGSLTFAARPKQILDPQHSTTFTGHAFIIIGVKTNFGVKEEVFGFYPVEHGAGLIKGPGMLKSEERCGPNDDCSPHLQALLRNRLSEVKETVTIPLTVEGRAAVYSEIKKWDSKSTSSELKQIVPSSDTEFRLFDRNCMDFVAAVASRLGYPSPDRSNLQTPAEFMAAFKPLALQEVKIREADRLSAEMAKKASEAEEKSQRADARRQAAEQQRREAESRERQAQERANQAEKAAADAQSAYQARRQAELTRIQAEQARMQAETIPVGWVPCTCPRLHVAYGKWVRGTLYHPANLNCPR